MLCVADTASVQFGQAVDEIVFRAFDAVVHTEIDDLHVFGYGMTLHELLRIAVSGTEEKEVDLVQRQFICKYQICFAIQSAMYVRDLVAGIARTVHKCNLGVRMIQQQAVYPAPPIIPTLIIFLRPYGCCNKHAVEWK